jgi:hypothetical protein
MTQEIIEMAQECGLIGMRPHLDGIYSEALVAFAKLVAAKAAAKEREACAKVCDDKHDTWRWDDEADSASGPRDCAAAIRARGQA